MLKKAAAAVLAGALILAVSGISAPAAETAGDSVFTFDGESGEPLVLVDDGNIVFSLTDVDPDSLWGYEWNVYLENHTDKTVMFSVDQVSVNGYMCDPFWAAEVEPGKKANSDITWFESSLEDNHIEEVREITLSLRCYDSDDWTADDIVNTTFTVDFGTDGTESVSAESPAENPEELLLDVQDEGMAFQVTGAEIDDGDYVLHTIMENRTDKTLMFSIDNESLNDYMASSFSANEIAAGKKAYYDIVWNDYLLEGQDLKAEDVRKAAFSLRVYNSDDWSEDDLLNEYYVIYPDGEESYTRTEREPAGADQVIYEDGSCRALAVSGGFDEDGDYEVLLYLENNTGSTVSFSVDGVSVNGFMLDPFWADTVTAGSRAYEELKWYGSTLEENSISSVEKIAGTFEARNAESYDLIGGQEFEVKLDDAAAE